MTDTNTCPTRKGTGHIATRPADAFPVGTLQAVCSVLEAQCNHFVNGRCYLRECMAQDERRALIWPARFAGCVEYKAVSMLRAMPVAETNEIERLRAALHELATNSALYNERAMRTAAEALNNQGQNHE